MSETVHPSQRPSGAPDENVQIPRGPRVPEVVVPATELEVRRQAVRKRTEEVVPGSGNEALVRVRKTKLIPLTKPRPPVKAREGRIRPPVKARERGSRELQPFPIQGPTVTSIAHGQVTEEKVGVLERRRKIIKRRGQERVFVLYLNHPASQEDFSCISLQDATHRILKVKQQFPQLDEDDRALVFKRVADIIISFMGDRFPRITDARVSSIVNLLYDDAAPRKISDRLEDYSSTQPQNTRPGDPLRRL
jgi:hypothetical protein